MTSRTRAELLGFIVGALSCVALLLAVGWLLIQLQA